MNDIDLLEKHPEFQFARPGDLAYLSEDPGDIPSESAARLAKSVLRYTENLARRRRNRLPKGSVEFFRHAINEGMAVFNQIERRGKDPVPPDLAEYTVNMMSGCERIMIAIED